MHDDHTAREAPERPLEPGRITRLVAQKRRPERVSVFLNGAFAFGAHQDIVVQFGLRIGLELDVADQERMLRADRLLSAKTKALGLLAHRPRTASEIRQRLRRSGYDDEVIDEVIVRLDELHYLDDEAYARDYVEARFNHRGYGPERIRRELLRKGVAGPVVEAALSEVFEGAEDALVETGLGEARKRWGRLTREADPARRRKKVYDFLLRRGFSYDTARLIVERIQHDDEP